MGLDITWYRECKLAPTAVQQDVDAPDGMFRAYVNSHFPGREGQIKDRTVYTYERSDGFRAGSYSGYNGWREQLAVLAGYPAERGSGHSHDHSAGAWAVASGPFWELINFADNEGIIGAEVSAKLAKDFETFLPQATAIGGYFAELYGRWRNAFEQAQHNGCVDFH